MDGIFPALLQEGRRIALPYVVKIRHTCLVTGYIPTIRRQVNVVFIPSQVGKVELRNLDLPVSHCSYL